MTRRLITPSHGTSSHSDTPKSKVHPHPHSNSLQQQRRKFVKEAKHAETIE
ncbi:hypothetical protein K470DRAFT_136026 [Piedraia hortae CBS 480.64]|uniref:Uncharacterized protein n=1 Tax=Piedraia hortae CBS 480.64 TaxID=1314780 RepID=A0A6A7BT90_9PEZI|nr:hypothetical protein K470DRAFT_136026 [Piedraia hortae CBS 480.64]